MRSETVLRSLVRENNALLESGIGVMTTIPEELYRAGHDSALQGGIGRHFRHVIEFYQKLLEREADEVNHASRRRDPRVEQDPAYASVVYSNVQSSLAGLEHEDPDAELVVVTEFLDSHVQPVRARSTLARELANLASHTIHHYAIIAILIRGGGADVPEHFGVAPSTLRFAGRNHA
jgi:uncharacterized damage-inducible protein DinB